MKLRPYQESIIDRTKKFLSEPSKELIIKLHTGLGKTFVMPRLALVLNKQGYNVLVLSDIMQLIFQLDEHFRNMRLNVSKIVSNEKTYDLSGIVLASEQTLYNVLKKEKLSINNLVILYDEAHKRRYGERFEKIIEVLEPKKLIGFTATPFDMNGVLMFDNIYEPITLYEAENKRYLTPIEYKIPTWIEQLDFDSIDKGNKDYSSKDIAKLYKTKEFGEWFKKFYESLEPKQTLIFTSNIDMADWIGFLINAKTYHSKNNDQGIINEFKMGKERTIVGVTSLTTGFDAPNIERIINLRPTKSIPLFIQMVGRGSRLYEGKDKCEFIDVTNCLLNFGLPEEFKGYRTKEEQMTAKQRMSKVEKYFEFNKKEKDVLDVNKEILVEFTNKLKVLNKSNYISKTTLQLINMFNSTDDIREIVLIANEYHRRKYGWFLKDKTLNKMIEEMSKYASLLEEYGKRKSTVKAYKTRIRNILNQGKKLASMIYFPSWFYEETTKKYGINY